jgi:type I restriction-modification system DNA methylase subunit
MDDKSLASYLWEAANILRGSAVDRTDWKGYILPLLFFKRISDVWDEETADWGSKEKSIDILGDAYEYLVGKFADVTRRSKAGEFYTPRSVVRMMAEILDPKEGKSNYDPTCGTGGMLLAAIYHVKRNGGDGRPSKLTHVLADR